MDASVIAVALLFLAQLDQARLSLTPAVPHEQAPVIKSLSENPCGS
jgi:hypothetical protein